MVFKINIGGCMMPLCPSTNRIMDLFNRQLLTDRRKNVIVAEHLKQWQKLGGFPKGISTPSGRVRFRESEIVRCGGR